MKYELGNKNVRISKKQLPIISTDVNGNTYKYKNEALTIFNNGKTPPIDIETATCLTKIYTDRILIPRKLLFHKDKFKGYTYKLINITKSNYQLIMCSKDRIIGNIAILEREIEKLSNNNILLNGISLSDMTFNGSIYLMNPNKYRQLSQDVYSEADLAKVNKYQLHLVLTALIMSEINRNKFDLEVKKKMNELLLLKDYDENSSDFLADIIGNNENVKQLTKKI